MFNIWIKLSFGLHAISVLSVGMLYVLRLAGLIACFTDGFPWKSTPANDYFMFYVWCVQTFLYLGIIFNDES